jgi:hypothetical protein
MDRKPQQQTLSIRVSDALREFLERSKHVISSGRGESVSTSDVAKILLESAKDDRLDVRLQVADLGRKPTESLVEIRKKWEAGQPRSRAEWIFLAQYIEAACDTLTEDPMAPGPEPFVALLQALLAVRGLRTHKGAGLDLYYLGNLVYPCTWNERNIDTGVVPDVLGKLIQEIRTSGNWKKASPVGRNFYVAIRDEELQGDAGLNAVLDPFMATLFRLAARGHWIKEKKPILLPRDPALHQSRLVDKTKQGDLWIGVQEGPSDVSLAIGMDARDLIFFVSDYPQIREFDAMLKSVTFGKSWKGRSFEAFASQASKESAAFYQLRRHTDAVVLSFSEKQWAELRTIYATVMSNPRMQEVFNDLGWIYGEL